MKAEFIKVVLACGAAAASVASGSLALAQAPAPPAAAAPPSSLKPRQAYPAQLTETRGQVQRFTLTPIGEIDGVILADGTEVHLPPHLTAQLLNAVKIGDSIVARGYRSATEPLVVAYSITDAATGQNGGRQRASAS